MAVIMTNKAGIVKVNFFMTIYESIAKISKYPTWARQPLGKAIIYLLMLSFLASLFSAVPSAVYFNKDLDKTLAILDERLPDFSIKDNILSISDNATHKVEVNEALTVVIDPKDKPNTDTLQNVAIGIYAYKTGYYIKIASMLLPFSYSDHGVINKNKTGILEMAKIFKLESILIFAFSIIFSVASKFIHALFLGLLALLFSRTTREELSFSTGFKLACYALTLPVVLEILANIVGANGDGFSIIYHLTAAVYQYIALSSFINHNDV